MNINYKVIFSSFAEQDLIEITEYYYNINTSYAEKLFSTIEEKVQKLKTFPEQGRIVPELEKQNIIDFRELIEGNYRIVYSIQEKSIIVYSIVDSRRNLEDVLIQKLIRFI